MCVRFSKSIAYKYPHFSCMHVRHHVVYILTQVVKHAGTRRRVVILASLSPFFTLGFYTVHPKRGQIFFHETLSRML